jgi:hypothetical protein
MRRLLPFLLLTCLALLPLRYDSMGHAARAHPALAQLPSEIIWAWERPEDLRWLPPEIGVAYVASTITLTGRQTLIHPRTVPLLLAGGAAVVPVLHVDMAWRHPPKLSPDQSARIAAELLRVARHANRNVVQLDFEVRRSQRPFLAATIATIRRQLDPRIALSSTALASWCLDDYWLKDSQADEIVPMAFRMGADQDLLRRRLLVQRGFNRQRCASAIGFSSDEPMMAVTPRRHYYFSPQAWTAASWQALRGAPRSTSYSSL